MRRAVPYLSLVMVSVLILSGCAAYSVAPVSGFAYSDVKAPLATTDNSSHSKVGTSYCTSFLGLVAIGDASIDAAMKDGGITKIHYVDYHTTSVLGIMAKFTVTVYGE